MKIIDDFLNQITMYRLVLYGLFILAGISIIFGFFGIISYSAFSLAMSLVILIFSCAVFNFIFAKILSVQRNAESAYITALILFFILNPQVQDFRSAFILILVSFLAIASKYVLAINKKHIFNPVAIGVLIIGLSGIGSAIWWVATPYMVLPLAVIGFLIVKKMKRFLMFTCFFTASLFILVFSRLGSVSVSPVSIAKLVEEIIFSWPILFFGTIMLTEPATTPPKKHLQIFYGLITGILFSIRFHIGSVYSTPELALVMGNIFSYIVSPKNRLVLSLKSRNKLSEDIYEFVFQTNENFSHEAGQYMEWTLEHKNSDSRGNRRYFTIASSPTEKDLRLGVKFSDKSSSFKKALVSLEAGDNISASGLAGDFVLSKDKNEKLVFIAGGIGVTPFRSMVKYLVDRNEKRDVTVFYSNKYFRDIVYRDVFDLAERQLGMKFVYAVTDENQPGSDLSVRRGFITPEMIMKEVPDYKERTFYVSGPHGMVTAFEDSLRKIGIPSKKIKTDLFPGFA